MHPKIVPLTLLRDNSAFRAGVRRLAEHEATANADTEIRDERRADKWAIIAELAQARKQAAANA